MSLPSLCSGSGDTDGNDAGGEVDDGEVGDGGGVSDGDADRIGSEISHPAVPFGCHSTGETGSGTSKITLPAAVRPGVKEESVCPRDPHG